MHPFHSKLTQSRASHTRRDRSGLSHRPQSATAHPLYRAQDQDCVQRSDCM